ncbi:RND family efflux transporter MFP subunit [Rhizobium sp. BK212]|nr:RND family efflux transporter MFP subunit [Rhizobium sp. BK212]
MAASVAWAPPRPSAGTARIGPLEKPFVTLATALVMVAFLSPFRNVAAEQAPAPALTVSLTTPVQRDWPETVPASGWLKPWQEAIIASEISGLRITDVLVDVGAVVTKGQTLVRLSQESVLADLRKQEAAVETAKASLSKAKANADRARQLRPSGALSDEKIVEYLADEQTATASLASEEAALDSERIRLAQTAITAVDDGIITSRSADLGAVVSAGTELFRMVRQQRVEWQAEVSARYLPRITEGLDVEINEPGDLPIRGKVRLVAPSVSTDTSRAIVYVTLPADVRPRVGLYVTGTIELRTTPALTVPETAIVFRDGISYLFTAGADQRVRRIRVETGRRNDTEVEIVSGIDQSSKVVTAGGAFLSDNALVKVAEND